MLQQPAALARQLAPAASLLAARLAPAAAAGFRSAAPALQETAPQRMEEAAQVVAAVMGEASPVPTPEPVPLPAGAPALRFDDPRAAFKVQGSVAFAGAAAA